MARRKSKRLKIKSLLPHQNRFKSAIRTSNSSDSSISDDNHMSFEESEDLSFNSSENCSDIFAESDDNYASTCSEGEEISDEEEISEDLNNLNLEVEIMEDEAMLKFPLDIFLDIMSRLPVRVLAKCRCVCKTWLKVIHHNRFVTMHHNRAVKSLNVSSTVIVPIKCCKGEAVNNIVVVHDHKEKVVKSLKQRIGSSSYQFEIVGTCHGLLCLYEQIYCEVYVANPVVGEYVKLPDTGVSDKIMDTVFGFGYDEVCNEYKVIRLEFESGRELRLKGEVYELRSGTWRSMGDISYPLRASSLPIYLNGALHWLTDEYAGCSCTDLIIALDVCKEDFFPIPPPPGFKFSSENYRYNLGDLKSNLCFFYWSSDNLFEIWTMNTYGVKDSWSKDYILSERELGRDSLYLHPLALLENKELLLEYNNESLLCYNEEDMTFRELDPQKLPSAFDTTIHVESLVSLRDLVGATTSKVSGSKRRWYRTARPIPSQQPA